MTKQFNPESAIVNDDSTLTYKSINADIIVHCHDEETNKFQVEFETVHYLVLIDFDFTGQVCPARMIGIEQASEVNDRAFTVSVLLAPLAIDNVIVEACCAFYDLVVADGPPRHS